MNEPITAGVCSTTKSLSAEALSGNALAASQPLRASMASELFRRTFSLPVALGALLVGWTFFKLRAFYVDPDVWWHIKIGQDILGSHHWPTTAPHSLTAPGMPWIAYEWLGEVVLALVNRAGGNTALFVLLVASASAAVALLYYCASLRSGNWIAGFIAAACMSTLVFLSFTLRPQMFGYVFLILLLITLESFRRGVNWVLWTVPAMFLLWVNIHGSFIVGIGVLAVYLGGGLKSFQMGDIEGVAWSARQRIQLETTLLLSLAVLPLTPYGAQVAVYPFNMMFEQPINVATMTEWRPMPINLQFGKIFLGVVVLVVVLQILFRFRWRLEELLLAIGGTAFACLHARMLLLFVPLVAPMLAAMMARFLPRYEWAKHRYVLNGLVIAAVSTGVILYFPSREFLQKKINAYFPAHALKYLNSNPVPGTMLNSYYFGGYLIHSGYKAFIDGRGDLYERSGVLADYLTVSEIQPGAFSVLDRYQVAWCLLEHDEELAVVLEHSPDWKKVYADETAAVFVRRGLETKNILVQGTGK
jgi:hypothetical protein